MNIVRIRSDGNVEIEIPFERVQDLFMGLGPVQEILSLAKTCGCCGSTNTKLDHRITSAGHSRYCSMCLECGADLRFIERRDGSGLFPDLKDENGQERPDNGWSIFVPQRQARRDDGGVKPPPVQQHANVPTKDDLDPNDIPF